MQEVLIGLSIGLGMKGLGELAKATNGIKKLGAAAIKSGKSLKDAQKFMSDFEKTAAKISSLQTQREALGSQIATLKNAAMLGAIAMPTKIAMDYESAMADVKKVVDFTDKADFSKFSADLLELTRTIPMSAQELATITASGGQLGIAKENLLGFTEVVAKMSTAFDMSADAAGESMATLMNIYGYTIKEAEAMGDTINHLSDNSAAKASSIVEVLKRVSGNAKAFGLSGDAAAALSSAFISLGKTPEIAGTAINALLTKLATAPDQNAKFQDALESMGISSQELADNIHKNPEAALDSFLGKLASVPKEEQMSVLTKLFGAEYSDDMALLVGSLDQYRKARALANDEAKKGSMDREFKNRSETTANALQLAKNSLNEIAINLGSLYLPALANAFSWFAKLGGGIADFVNNHQTLAKVLSSSLTAIFAFKIAFLSANWAWLWAKETYMQVGQVLKLVNFLIPDMKMLKMSFATLRPSVVKTTLATKTYAVWTKIATIWSKAWARTNSGLGGSFAAVLRGIKGTIMGFKALRIAMISTGIGALVVALGFAAAFVIEHWEQVKATFAAVGEFLGVVFGPAIAAVKSLFGEGSGWISAKWGALREWFAGFFAPVLSAWSSFSGRVSGLFAPIIAWLGEKWGAFRDFMAGLFDPVVKAWHDVIDPIFKWFEEKFGDIIAAWGKLKNTISGIWGGDDKEGEKGETGEKKGGFLDGAKSLLGFGESETPAPEPAKATPANSNLNYAPAPVAVAQTASGANITLNFSGDFSIATSNGKFDLREFEAQIIDSVRKAFAKDARDKKNRTIDGE